MSSQPIPPRSAETNPPMIALFPGDEAALAAVQRLGLKLLRFAGPGVALLAPVEGISGKLYAEGAKLVVC